jgi:putative acetyltransferase
MKSADAITTELVTAPTAYAAALLASLDRELSALYTREQRHGLTLDELFKPHVRFFVAWLGGEPAGCGGLAFYDGFAEVKRMYVRDAARGRGVARTILDRIEMAAREGGHSVLRLETGAHQAAAMRLYERAGFRHCKAFGDYVDMPPGAIVTSVFFEKTL